MNTRILLFAGLRERLNKSEVQLDLPQGTKVCEILPILFGEEAAKLTRCTLFAINQNYVTPETELHDGDELTLIPPVAGG
ncbi:MAG: hypothetical protein A2W61_06645 [Deltaproteobacteria bacterium RIFCSPLOWO2_01_44_7]|nr:MAG: hypothetical protein A2712_01190 [Deltaproteobacteria bacterium RIFCSPHIGHO2_01_FULL_43_49]OGQ15250.1 MAG: hypothetical protein A3D22_04285 [Deltaproteobacteria bacterium RIFCSPHIGHO2_02_FULL_44_53]OGQ27127.1 MAG: hypothetical protein A3D98_01780 [Deltaproteobacteria bacterium RIFCSPHIGHO2_12_FULL_44_21]OGQ31766.1 MAG: hypothetical protein A2979_05445 [Deltaproteobacteria bacterium RIFCSPLOWO2_01_FULL_45_74]OGQ42155.1 MAG: hypothetical protein A2W61_06645 [Deltaproteobacteria bacterium 